MEGDDEAGHLVARSHRVDDVDARRRTGSIAPGRDQAMSRRRRVSRRRLTSPAASRRSRDQSSVTPGSARRGPHRSPSRRRPRPRAARLRSLNIVAIGRHRRPDIWVQRHDAGRPESAQELLDVRRAGSQRSGDRSGVNSDRRTRVDPSRVPLDVERVCRRSVVVEPGQRRRRAVGPRGLHRHAGLGEVPPDQLAVGVVAESRGERDVEPGPAEPDRDVGSGCRPGARCAGRRT